MYNYRRRIKQFFITLVLCMGYAHTQAQDHLYKNVKLAEIDTNSLQPDYYLLTFKDQKRRYQVLSPQNTKPQAGCWRNLQIGTVYKLHLEGTSFYNRGNLSFPLKGGGLAVAGSGNGEITKSILEKNEYFYLSDDINGLLIKSNTTSE